MLLGLATLCRKCTRSLSENRNSLISMCTQSTIFFFTVLHSFKDQFVQFLIFDLEIVTNFAFNCLQKCAQSLFHFSKILHLGRVTEIKLCWFGHQLFTFFKLEQILIRNFWDNCFFFFFCEPMNIFWLRSYDVHVVWYQWRFITTLVACFIRLATAGLNSPFIFAEISCTISCHSKWHWHIPTWPSVMKLCSACVYM